MKRATNGRRVQSGRFDFESALYLAGIAVTIAAVSFIILMLVQDGAESITLRRSEWICEKSMPVSGSAAVLVGKVVTLVPVTRMECFRYSRRTSSGDSQ